jgi:HTH-type transcriptional regulator, competence development regulator
VFSRYLTIGWPRCRVSSKQGHVGLTGGTEKFGAFVRRERERKAIGLREMAKLIGVSPTYLSKIERDEFAPPAEDKVQAMAEILDWDPDELLARAGRVASDITDIIKGRPIELSGLLRITVHLSAEEIDVLRKQAEKVKLEPPSTEIPTKPKK